MEVADASSGAKRPKEGSEEPEGKTDTAEDDQARRTEEAALRQAAESGDIDTLTSILNSGLAFVGAENEEGFTALILATVPDHRACVEALLAAGAEVQPPADSRHTALRAAALCGHTGLVQLFLGLGADPNTRSAGGRDAIMGACFPRRHVTEDAADACLALLLAAVPAPDVTCRNDAGESALDLANIRGLQRLAYRLLVAGAATSTTEAGGAAEVGTK